MKRNFVALFLLFILTITTPLTVPTVESQESFDLVIRNGRVMDPESGRDEIANVGIRGQTVAAITKRPIRGRQEIDATGLVVAPGFIDILSSTQADRETHI